MSHASQALDCVWSLEPKFRQYMKIGDTSHVKERTRGRLGEEEDEQVNLDTREAIERIAAGEKAIRIAEDYGTTSATLRQRIKRLKKREKYASL